MNHTLRSIAFKATLTLSALLSSPSFAIEGLSANVGLTSNYLWRGVSQTDDKPAVSGGIDYAMDSGWYAGAWVSNVDFGDDASHEFDWYFGYGGELGNGLSYDLGYIYYAYPDSAESDSSNEYDFAEVHTSLSFSNFTLGANYGVNNDDGAEWADGALYVSLDAEFEVADGLSLAFHAGSYRFKDAFDAGNYSDYGFSLSKNNFTLGLSDTNMDNDDVKFYLSYAIAIDL